MPRSLTATFTTCWVRSHSAECVEAHRILDADLHNSYRSVTSAPTVCDGLAKGQSRAAREECILGSSRMQALMQHPMIPTSIYIAHQVAVTDQYC
jgi:hypothetical protein